MSAKNIHKIFFSGFLTLGLLLSVPSVNAAYAAGGIFSDGSCTNCSATRKSNKQVKIVDGTRKRGCSNCSTVERRSYAYAQQKYTSVDRPCGDLAPFALTNVDFKLNQSGSNPYGDSQVGNYRFRIVGCRRASKKAILNQGRVMQKDMAFHDVFRKSADKCYKVMEIPNNVCLANNTVRLPEYVLTAEINDFFMNVCDEYDWENSRPENRRDGSAEMTVTWRLMNLSQSKVLWKGVTTGYAEVEDGVFEGETRLAEEAFADAAARLSSLPGFEAKLKVRVSEEEVARERAALVAFDARYNPGKCGYTRQPAMQYPTPCGQPVCPMMAQPMMVAQPMMMAQPICPCAIPQPCVCTQPVCSCPIVSCPCAQPVPAEPKVEEFVDVKTKKKIIEQKIITKTRVETPAPVCQQVCQPVCPQPTCQVQCTKTCQQPKCRRICTEVCDESTGKCTNSCQEDCSERTVQPKVEVLKYTPAQPAPKPEPVVVEEPVIEEKGGVVETHKVYENCVDENGNLVYDPDYCPNWLDWASFDLSCIVDRPAYNELSPENMLKVRSDVVDVTNFAGKKGTGLLVSDSYVLTSTDLVNKHHNTYDVKTLNGNMLKATAVRVNPGKKVALLHLDTPATYTPLALNMDLPAVDQEGFIALGRMDEASKNYLDDNGKIHGYRYSDVMGTEVVVDTLVNKVSPGSVLIDKLGTVNGISNTAKQTEEGMDLFLPTDTTLKSVGLTICERKVVTEQILQEVKAPEAMPAPKRK